MFYGKKYLVGVREKVVSPSQGGGRAYENSASPWRPREGEKLYLEIVSVLIVRNESLCDLRPGNLHENYTLLFVASLSTTFIFLRHTPARKLV